MIQKILVLLLFFFSTCSGSTLILPEYPEKNLTIGDKILIKMLKECNLGLNNIILWPDDNPDLVKALMTTPSFTNLESWIILSHYRFWRFANLTAINGYVVVFNSVKEWNEIWQQITFWWKCTKDCTIIFSIKMPNSCPIAVQTLKLTSYAYYDYVYFICIDQTFGPIIITLDQYQNLRRPTWTRLNWKVDSLYRGSYYFRKYSADLCQGLHFDRNRPTENITVLVAAAVPVRNIKKGIYSGIATQLEPNDVSPALRMIKKLFKIKFYTFLTSYEVTTSGELENYQTKSLATYHVDMMANGQQVVPRVDTIYLHPTLHDSYVILSHNSAAATPLEKITKFYGIWTLVSLIIISGLTFVVIYLKTNRNTTLAGFDVLRLLINSGVEIPINTLSLKIFFCMIFLYFTVLHATFSGNLPRFLTIPEFHDNIDSLEDLTNPRIKTIYDGGYYRSREGQQYQAIRKKITKSVNMHRIVHNLQKHQTTACIISKLLAEAIIADEFQVDKMHVSKNNYGHIMNSLGVRPRFIAEEKFRWATTYIFDVAADQESYKDVRKLSSDYKKTLFISEIKFKNISVTDLKFAFFFLIVGNTLGIICFLIELVIARQYHRKISVKYLTQLMTFKLRKKRINVRRIIVKPKPPEPKLDIEEIA